MFVKKIKNKVQELLRYKGDLYFSSSMRSVTHEYSSMVLQIFSLKLWKLKFNFTCSAYTL